MTLTRRSVLISGASIAGPALAFWLHRAGFAVTVVERASTVRGGGYPIDLRGTAMEVVERMGLGDPVRARDVDSRAITFLEGDGVRVATLRPVTLIGGDEKRDVELARGDLTTLLYDAVRDDVEFVFDDSIAGMTEHDAGVDVTFRHGPARTFDLVVGADGLHSAVRRVAFGPEEQFHHYLGYCFAGFTLPNDLGLSHEGVVWNLPGRAAVLYAAGDNERLFGFLNVARTDPPLDGRDPRGQRETIAAAFDGAGWAMVPRMVAAMNEADDLFADVVSQIRMPRWSHGRVVLVGDAAFAPSFLTGQGSSLAVVGAYVLAGELAAAPDHVTAFAAYEERMRDFVERNQARADGGLTSLTPRTPEELEGRNRALREQTTLREEDMATVTSLALPEYRFAT